LALLLALGCGLAVVSVSDSKVAQWLFVNTTYYCLMALVVCWAGTYLHAARGLGWQGVVAWARENWRGLMVAFGVTAVAGFAVEPAFRMLSDEANLVGVSKNLFASKTSTFTVSGKYYYGSYWDVDVAIDRRPTLFPFLVSLLHSVRGYSHENAFLLNLLMLPVFLLVSYRLGKSLGGETFGVVAALFVAAHPVTLISIRSSGFDFLAACFAVLSLKSLLDYCREQSPSRLAILWLNLCLFAEIRYESALFIPPVVALLVVFKMLSPSHLRPRALIYALTPVFVLPRVWQGMLKGNVPEQEPGAVTFSVENFLNNTHEYFQPLLEPTRSFPAHSPLLIALGLVGCILLLQRVAKQVRAREWKTPELRFAAFVMIWMLVQVVVVFSYVWGRAQFPSSARLVIAVDTFFSFAAAWVLVRCLARWRPLVAIFPALAIFTLAVPVAAQDRMMNRLTQTRESAATWKFFERLGEKRILIVTDRPNHFTIMGYGAMSFQAAKQDSHLFTALDRRLFLDVYVIQQIQLSTMEPLPGYELWTQREVETVFEFQNDANVLVRVSRFAR
jgi:hypothetical protein